MAETQTKRIEDMKSTEGVRARADEFRLLVVSPVRNEAAHIETVVRAMAAQTRAPDLWLVADDGSGDGTREILRDLEGQVPFLRLMALGPKTTHTTDRLALALEARAFNVAMEHVDWRSYTHIAKLDGDIELPPDYFERLLAEFKADPALGIAGGSIIEPTGRGGAWKPVTVPDYHVHGALKLYTRECFEGIGGVHERLGWDTIDETYARMRGYRTASVGKLVVRHHRPSAVADGGLRGRARHGQCAYILRYGLPWTLMRSVKVARTKPRLLSGVAFAFGYLRSAALSLPRVEDREFATFVRRELRHRIVRAVLPPVRAHGAAQVDRVHLAASFGGHLELLTTVREALREVELVWVTAPGPKAAQLEAEGDRVHQISLVDQDHLAGTTRNVMASLRIVLRERPRVVLTTGAGSVAPFCLFARLLGSRLIFVETTARVTGPSRAGTLLAALSSQVIVQWPEMSAVYPGAIVCRPALLEGHDAPVVEGEGTFVAVGSYTAQFNRLLEIVDRAVEGGVLPKPVRAQTGVSTYEPRTYERRPWLPPEDIGAAARNARYVVCHGGSGLMATALRNGRKPLALARLQSHGEHVDDHQLQLVGKLSELGLAVALNGEITEAAVAAAAAGPAALMVTDHGESLDDALRRLLLTGNAAALD